MLDFFEQKRMNRICISPMNVFRSNEAIDGFEKKSKLNSWYEVTFFILEVGVFHLLHPSK
jgi:hypothetical protein